jgi:transposase
MDWPAASPDLNPIENVWSKLKRAINNRKTISETREALIQAIQEEWEYIQVEDFNGMISSMPKRMRACIAAKGGHTKW